MTNLVAEITGGTPLGVLKGLGPLGNVLGPTSDPALAFANFTSTLSTAMGILTISAGIWFIIQILAGAFQWLASGGEKQGVENAKKRITNAIMGLFVVVFSYALISIVGLIFGFNILSPFKSLMGIPIGGQATPGWGNPVTCTTPPCPQ